MPKDLIPLFHRTEKVVLTTHVRPDGDAIGSELALARWLILLGKDVRILNADPAPHNVDWLPGTDDIELFDGSLDQREAIAQADVVVVCDTNTEDRMGSVGPAVRASGAARVLIDHHTDPESWFDHVYRSESVSSTGELIHALISADDPAVIDEAIATCLYVAIMTDTGSFRFSNVRPQVHRVIADLLERGGIDPSVIHAEVYDKRSLEGLRLFSRVLQTLELFHGGSLAALVVSSSALRDTGAPVEETEGFVNWGLTVEGVRISLIFTETERGTKVSFRSKGDDHVHRWAQALGGGGHPNAAGAFVRKPLQDAISFVVAQAPRYLDRTPVESNRSPDDGDGLSVEDEAYLASLMQQQYRETRP